MKKKHTQFQAFLPGSTNFGLTWFRTPNLYPISGQKNPFSLGHPYCKSSIKPPPLSQISSPSNKPPFSFKPLFLSPPLPLLFFTNLWYTIFINHNCNTSCGMVHDSFFSPAGLSDLFWSSAAWPTTIVLALWHFALWRTDTIVFAKLCRPSPSNVF